MRTGERKAVLESIEAGLTRLVELGVAGLGTADLTQYLRRLRALADRVELLTARGLAEMERSGGYYESGASDLTSWASQTLKLSPEAAHDRVVLARGLGQLTATADLLTRGELGFEQAAVVARSAARVRPEDALTVEGMILGKGLALDAGRMRREAAVVVAEVDGEAVARDATRARERRSLRIGPDINGSARISGDLTSECLANLRAGLEPFMAPVSRDDGRTAEQRRHDALEQLAKQAVLGGSKGGTRRKPQVVVVAPLSAMLGEAGPPALLQGLTPLSPAQLDEFICVADLSAVLKDDAGNIAYAGKASRRFSAAKRRAMVADHPTCIFEGCSRPAADCDGHHLVEYSRGGETTLGNGAGLCSVHQPMVHRDGWEVVRLEDGSYKTLHPNHPDNPKRWLSQDEYRRRWRAAIFESRQRRARRKGARSRAPAESRE